MPAPPVLPTSFDATNVRADDAAPPLLWNNGKEKHHPGASPVAGRNDSFTSAPTLFCAQIGHSPTAWRIGQVELPNWD